ncbi:HD domain-containing protein [Auriculariales sp. MPI-PUGE-AT-0066]|nr:HD domain-containing protein [Auriculariales sp. MPI-PUGE-AT-0066]
MSDAILQPRSLAFFHIIERLKTQKRTGWLVKKIPDAESISDHMYRMGILAMCTSDENLDVSKCVMLALVHDLAEAQAGDITPHEGISKTEKRRLEEEAMHNFVQEMFHESIAGKRILTLWQEYEDQQTLEARFVKDLDRLEVSLQAREYEQRHGSSVGKLQEFYDSSLPNIKHPEVKAWGESLLAERERDISNNSS